MVPAQLLCCYPGNVGFAAAVAASLLRVLEDMPAETRVLFSAHGLPQRIVAEGDPYPWQVQQSVTAVLAALGRQCDAAICYQSRVGPLRWLEPSIDAEIRRAGSQRRPLIVVPIAFVSEHSETLVELDRDYARLAAEVGVPIYRRLPTVSSDHAFIAGLAELVNGMLRADAEIASSTVERLCPLEYARCPLRSFLERR
jgi:ferrochelatase